MSQQTNTGLRQFMSRLYQDIQVFIQQELTDALGNIYQGGQINGNVIGALPSSALPPAVQSATTPIAMQSGVTSPPVPLYTSDGTDYVYMSPTVV